MRRAAIAVAAAAALLGAAPAAHARTDDGAKPIVFISGAESGTVDCGKFWGKLSGRMRHVGLKVGGVDTRITGPYELLTSGGAGEGCGPKLASDQGLEAQAQAFTEWLLLTHKGDDVDVVAQGTAGVMVRVALAKTKLAIEDVVTLGAPHAGSAKLMAKCDVWISPTTAAVAEPNGLYNLGREGVSAEEYIVTADRPLQFTFQHNVMGTPAISLPLALHSAGLPIGVQLGANPAQEHILLQLAAVLEQEMPWKDRTPPLHVARAGR